MDQVVVRQPVRHNFPERQPMALPKRQNKYASVKLVMIQFPLPKIEALLFDFLNKSFYHAEC